MGATLANLSHQGEEILAEVLECVLAPLFTNCMENWRWITQDQWVLEAIWGYQIIAFTSEPHQTQLPRQLSLSKGKDLLDREGSDSERSDRGAGLSVKRIFRKLEEGNLRSVGLGSSSGLLHVRAAPNSSAKAVVSQRREKTCRDLEDVGEGHDS